MPKIKVNVSKTRITLLLTLLLVLSGSVAVWAFNEKSDHTVPQARNFGHSPDEVVVDVSVPAPTNPSCAAGNMTLGDAIKNKCLGGGAPGTPSGGFTNFKVFDANPASWPKPDGVTKFMVELWGAGGGGYGSGGVCTGGGGGGYGREIFTVAAAAATYNLHVGAGGKSSSSIESNDLATNGEDSTITVGSRTIRAEGGDIPVIKEGVQFGGRGGYSDALFSLRGGNGHVAIYGTPFAFSSGGTSMAPFTQGGSGALGGEGAFSYGGPIAGITKSSTSTAVYAAEVPGGGGSCGYDNSQTPAFRQPGADGRIVIWW